MQRWAIGSGVGIILVLIAAILLFGRPYESVEPQLIIADNSYYATVMQTDDERQRGLSNTPRLSSDQAMLFVFPGDGRWGIWMKDMRYAIDIVWLDRSKNVVHMVENAQPDSYPETTYHPSVPARYVIELPSGTIKRTAITSGMRATLPPGV